MRVPTTSTPYPYPYPTLPLQVYDVAANPFYDPALPLRVPDPAATEPLGWDAGEDGAWAAPTVPNTAALAASPPFVVTKAPEPESRSTSGGGSSSSSSSSSSSNGNGGSTFLGGGWPSPAPAPWPTRDPRLSAEQRATAWALFEAAKARAPGGATGAASDAPPSGKAASGARQGHLPQDPTSQRHAPADKRASAKKNPAALAAEETTKDKTTSKKTKKKKAVAKGTSEL